MRFSIVRKINLGNIDKSFAGETEEIGVHDGDSFDEVTKVADKLASERVGFYKAAAAQNMKVSPGPTQVGPGHTTPAPVIPASGGPVPVPHHPIAAQPGGISSNPPADLA